MYKWGFAQTSLPSFIRPSYGKYNMPHTKSHIGIHTGCLSPFLHTTLVLMGLGEFRSSWFSLVCRSNLPNGGLPVHQLTLSINITLLSEHEHPNVVKL